MLLTQRLKHQGSIHEGGELDMPFSRCRCCIDNPDDYATVIGDGEGETGPLDGWLVVKYLLEPSQRWGDPSNLLPQWKDPQPNHLRTQTDEELALS